MGQDTSLGLKNLIEKVLAQYADIYDHVRSNMDYSNPFRGIVEKNIPEVIGKELQLGEEYRVYGSCGKGLWTKVPWVAICNRKVTTSATKGVYVVYLFNKDTRTVYLSLAAAATEALTTKAKESFTGVAGHMSKKSLVALTNQVVLIRKNLGDKYFLSDNEIKSGAASFDAGTIYYKGYHIDELPSEKELFDDLRKMVSSYEKYIESKGLRTMDDENDAKNKKVSLQMESTQLTLAKVKKYISSKGFTFDESLIKNFYLSLKSKPFCILAGTSGTGKTRLVKLFAEAIGAEFKLVPVRPDWSDSSDLFGHVDLNGRFIPGALIDFIKQAQDNPEKPHFLCLDEMNLARVEYYMSDFLSVIETRDLSDGRITSEPLVSLERYGEDEAAKKKYGVICFPENLYLIGTVNMDETTFPFSKKVLDRANTIEFNYVDLTASLVVEEDAEKAQPVSVDNTFLKSEYLLLNQCGDEAAFVTAICAKLEEINKILAKANAHVGYRVRDEIVFYMMNNKKAQNLLSENEALDNEILQKILPRLQGSAGSVKSMLGDLFVKCVGPQGGDYTQQKGDCDSAKMENLLAEKKTTVAYPKSAEKLAMMVRRFEEDGFTSYWL